MGFVRYHEPCPLCQSSDAASVNEDGSAYCFSCYKHIANYENSEAPIVKDFVEYKNNSMNTNEGSFQDLTDRKISMGTARKYGVKATINHDGVI